MTSIGLKVIFNGNCREAVAFYAQAFGQELPPISTYAEQESFEPDFQVSDYMKSRVRSAVLHIAGNPIEFCDTPDAFGLVCGNNMQLTVTCENPGEAKRAFERLSEGGEVEVAFHLAEGRYYGALTDRYHTDWLIRA